MAIPNNQKKFEEVKRLKLPINQYAITGSGPLGVRDLKEINDIDIIVASSLWNDLVLKFPSQDQNGIKKIIIPNSSIKIFCESSFYSQVKDENQPTVSLRIKDADIIDGLPFESLKNILYFKYKMGREKDIIDIKIIKSWLEIYS